MNRIDRKFAELRKNNKKALITFVTAGDPTLETTMELVKEMEKSGADIIELGIPYSDPVAEGPVIQEANIRALGNKIRIKDIMASVTEIRKDVKLPILYLLYFNCILQYGPERFFKDCLSCGIDGVIIPDLPFEERDEIEDVAVKNNVYIISLVTPTSKERVHSIAKKAKGFLYCVSSLGVTGIREEFATDFEEFFSDINGFVDIPTAVGFGISNEEHVRRLSKYFYGVIIGSAIVKVIAESKEGLEAVNNVGSFVKKIRKALDN